MNPRLYILDGKLAVVEPDCMTWAAWFEHADRIVKQEWVENVHVSTIFIGLDHNFAAFYDGCKDKRPILFETMLFTNRAGLSQKMWRYHDYEEAEAGHARVVADLKNKLKKHQ